MNRGNRQAAVITGIGVISPLGASLAHTWNCLLAGHSAVRDWPDLAAEGHRVTRACRVEHLVAPTMRRGRSLAIGAAEQALQHAGIVAPRRSSGAIYVGSTLGESAAFESAATIGEANLAEYRIPSFCEGISAHLGVHGEQQALATACAAGNYALGAAAASVKCGKVEWALAGGVEPFSRLSLVGFSRSRAMASGDCHPFDRRRSGMLLGEGAAMFVIERAEDAIGRGAHPLATIESLGLCCDAYHPTAPRPDGSGMAAAMLQAIKGAGVTQHEIDWVNIHGTGTRASDAAEGLALRAVFGGAVLPALSGSKGALGHALGAASAIEAAICVQGLLEQRVPPTPGHSEVDPEIGLSCQPAERELRLVLNNAFAFGGLNSALLLAQWPESQL